VARPLDKDKQYFSISDREKYCSYCDKRVNLRYFRRSNRKNVEPDTTSYYLPVCKPCESDVAAIRQHLKTGYKYTIKSISEDTIKRFLDIKSV
jgi:hypothetical protein